MIKKESILTYVKNTFDTDPDYPWAKCPEYG